MSSRQIMYLNAKRVQGVASVFRRIGLERIKRLEDIDPQMRAARIIEHRCTGKAPLLLYINALISYMLSMPGETYWWKYAEYVSERCPREYYEAIRVIKEFTTEYNRFALEYKLARLRILGECRAIILLIENRDYKGLQKAAAQCLGVDPDAKTIVFAVKMAYYGYKAQGVDDTLPREIPIPVDRRISRLTVLSGIVETSGEIEDAIQGIMRKPETARKAWGLVAEESGIPPLHLDAPLWILGRQVHNKTRAGIMAEISRNPGLVEALGENLLYQLVNQLFYKIPP